MSEATPKTIMRTMGVKGLTLYHLKSHLQVLMLLPSISNYASLATYNKQSSLLFDCVVLWFFAR